MEPRERAPVVATLSRTCTLFPRKMYYYPGGGGYGIENYTRSLVLLFFLTDKKNLEGDFRNVFVLHKTGDSTEKCMDQRWVVC